MVPAFTAPIYIRGVGIKSDGSAAAFYVDGVPYYEPITFETDLSDIASIEVLRGPQGTLFGRNSLGGLINIHTLTPFDGQDTKLNVDYGSYNDLRTSASTRQRLSKTFGLTAVLPTTMPAATSRTAMTGSTPTRWMRPRSMSASTGTPLTGGH